MRDFSENTSDKGATENEKALASFISGAIVLGFNILYSIFAAVFRILAVIV